MKDKFYVISFYIIALFPVFTFAQKNSACSIYGKIIDADSGAPLEYANIIAKDTSGIEKMLFTLSNEKGQYELSFKDNITYEVSISYLGYNKMISYISLSANEKKTLNFTLEASDILLNEIVIKESIPPVIYKQDTIIYDAASFATGEERKLKELLNRFPGVEVDRNNAIYVHGQKVDRVLVENEPFFGGNSELAVKSIPSNAVSKVEVLKEYNDVAFLSSVSSDNEMVINIKLKEDKKRFVFGDIELGAGFERKYNLGTNLFYYSPKINVYGIGGSNNANIELLSIEQFIQLQGGFMNIIGRDGNIINNSQFDLLDAFTPQNYSSNTSNLSAIGVDYKLKERVKLSAFGLYSKQKIGLQSEISNTYFLGDNLSYFEKRTVKERLNKQISFFKTTLTYDKKSGEYLSIDLTYNSIRKHNFNDLNSSIAEVVDSFAVQQKNKPSTYKGMVNWHKKFSKTHISSLQTTFQISTNETSAVWESNKAFLETEIPWIANVDSSYVLNQYKTEDITRFDTNFKHYYIINDKNHLSLKSGWSFNKTNSDIQDFQSLGEQRLLIEEHSHGVNQILLNGDLYLGVTFRNKTDCLESEIGITGHQLKWNFRNVNLKSRTLNILLPHAKFEFNIPRIGNLNLSYSMNAYMPKNSDFFAGIYVNNFNELRKGSEELQPEVNHNFGIYLFKYNIINSSSFYIKANLAVKDKNIQNTFVFNGIERISIPYIEGNNAIAWRLNSKYEKNTKLGKITPVFNWNYSKYSQILNFNDISIQQHTAEIGLKIERNINKNSFIEVWYKKRYFLYKENNKKNPTINFDELGVDVSWRLLNNFSLKPTYLLTKFSGNQHSVLHSLNATLEYKKENSPFVCRLILYNAFGNQNVLNNSYNRFYHSESLTATFSRYILGSVIYDL